MLHKLTTEEIQQELLCILKRFHEYCQNHHLTYFIFYGTLLGAVRHKGFIPWDDDIDVVMPREDYERFLALAETESIDSHLSVNSHKTDNYYFPFTKIIDSRIQVKEKNRTIISGLWIDVFPLDGVPTDQKACWRHISKARLMKLFALAGQYNFFGKDWRPKAVAKRILKLFSIIYGRKRLCIKMNEHALKWSFSQEDSCGNMAFCGSEKIVCFPRDMFKQSVLLEFENEQFYTIRDYELFLKQRYGAYHELPPENQREFHIQYATRQIMQEEDSI